MDRDNNDLRNEYSRHDTSILNDSEASGAGTTYRMTARLKLKATLEWGRETLVYEHVFVDKNNAVIRCV